MAKKKQPKDYLRPVDEEDNTVELSHVDENGKKKTIFKGTGKQFSEAVDKVTGEGHNVVAGDQLLAIIQRIEGVEEDMAKYAQDRKEIYAEAKGNGFDVKTIRRIIALRKIDKAERDEADYLLSTYMKAIGMQMALDFGGKNDEKDE